MHVARRRLWFFQLLFVLTASLLFEPRTRVTVQAGACQTNIAIDPFSPLPWQANHPGQLFYCAPQQTGASGIAWDFGDGTPLAITPAWQQSGADRVVSHAYSSAGLFTVRASYTDDSGSILAFFGAIEVIVQDCSGYNEDQGGLQITSAGEQSQQTIDSHVVLMACASITGTFAPDTAFRWSFGDGTVLQSAVGLSVVSHSYLFAGEYTVVLTTTSQHSATTSTSASITICPASSNSSRPCRSGIEIPSLIEVDEPEIFVYCAQEGLGRPVILDWYFGDGTSSVSTQNVMIAHTFTQPGVYAVDVASQFADGTVTLSSGDAYVLQCPDSKVDTTIVAYDSESKTTFQPGQSIVLQLCLGSQEHLPVDQALLFHWVFGDGSAGTPSDRSLAAQHSYQYPDKFIVECRLLVSPSQTIIRSWQTTITVKPAFSQDQSSPSSPSSTTSNGLSAWDVLGIVVAVLLTIGLIVLIGLFFYVRHASKPVLPTQYDSLNLLSSASGLERDE